MLDRSSTVDSRGARHVEPQRTASACQATTPGAGRLAGVAAGPATYVEAVSALATSDC